MAGPDKRIESTNCNYKVSLLRNKIKAKILTPVFRHSQRKVASRTTGARGNNLFETSNNIYYIEQNFIKYLTISDNIEQYRTIWCNI